MSPNSHSKTKDYLNSFGRRMGKSLTPTRKALMNKLYPALEITLSADTRPSALFKNNPEKIVLEIGFGAGEHLAGLARHCPSAGYIGCEPFMNGVAQLVKRIDDEKLKNIRIFGDDVRLLLPNIQPHSVDDIYILFPDPWPKPRHHKRRLVNQHTLDMLARVHRPSGALLLASDHPDYAAWMLEQIHAHSEYEWQAKAKADWQTPPEFWVNTRYEEKALASDVPIFIEAIRS